jgi:hypothetical protein
MREICARVETLDRLPAILKPTALTTPTDTPLVPALIADAGDPAA